MMKFIKRIKDFLAIVLLGFLLYVLFELMVDVSYVLLYQGKVEKTIRDMVKENALK